MELFDNKNYSEMRKMEFAGVTFLNGSQHQFEDVFEIVDETSIEPYAITKEVYHHDYGDDIKFDYQYVVRVVNMDEYETCATNMIVELLLVPTLSSLCQKSKNEIMSYSGLEDEAEVNMGDLLDNGYYILIDHKSWENHEIGDNVFEDNEVKFICLSIANILASLDSLKAFRLDRYVNRIGTTGWDMLDSWVNGTDWVKVTMDKYKEE